MVHMLELCHHEDANHVKALARDVRALRSSIGIQAGVVGTGWSHQER
jgi:hypothetical protein